MAVKFKKGFTMVELLVAMAIIGLLIATAIWGIGVAQQSARNTQRREAGSQILAGFSEYYARYNAQVTHVAFGSDYICLSDGAMDAAAVTACGAGRTYKVVLNGVAKTKITTTGMPINGANSVRIPRDTAAVGTTPAGVYKSDGSNTVWNLQNAGGTKICVELEGGGYGNLSEPQSLPCP